MEQYFHHICDGLKRVVLECKDGLRLRPLVELPIEFMWPHRPGVTLMGDAAHVMTSFAGVGVNVGIADALVFGREIVAASRGERSMDDAVQKYEEEMFLRAEANALKTARGKEGHFSKDGAQHFADRIKRMKDHYGSV